MKLAFNGATSMRADLVTDIEAASAAGFDYLEIWAAKLREFLKEHPTSDLKALLDQHNLKPYSINSIEHITFRNEDDYAKIKAECEELCCVAAEIDCPYVVVVPGKLPVDANKDVIVDESVRVLNELGDIAAKHKVSLAFEFLGQTDCSVQTLGLADEIVKKVGRSNIGLVLDSFHFYAGNSTFESIDALNAEKLFIFHINDSEDRPKAELNDSHRLLPGLGILPLKEIKAAFDRIGYDRIASVEIFRPEYWERDPFELAKDAREATIRVLG
jgi:2-keto-myo-inositol isomerase